MSRVVRVLTLASLVLIAASGCRALLDLPDVGSELGAEDGGGPETATPGLPRPETGPPATCANLYRPREGVYAYAPDNFTSTATRSERTMQFFPDGGSKEFSPRTSLPQKFYGRIQHGEGDTFSFQVDFSEKHRTTFVFKASMDQGLQVLQVTEGLLNVLNVIATCDPAVDLIPCAMTTDTRRANPVGVFTIFDSGAGEFGTEIDFTYVAPAVAADSLVGTSGGKLVDTFHIKEKRSFKRNLSNSQQNEYWFSKENGLLIKASLRSGTLDSPKIDGVTITPFTGVSLEYENAIDFSILSPDPVATLDGGIDANAP